MKNLTNRAWRMLAKLIVSVGVPPVSAWLLELSWRHALATSLMSLGPILGVDEALRRRVDPADKVDDDV